jgi:predicted  nucleic acid-binding Zn-ribbon protein
MNLQTQISKTEANIAFFEARFALIQHQPDSIYKQAQLKAYQAMHKQLSDQLERLQRKQKILRDRKNSS